MQSTHRFSTVLIYLISSDLESDLVYMIALIHLYTIQKRSFEKDTLIHGIEIFEVTFH